MTALLVSVAAIYGFGYAHNDAWMVALVWPCLDDLVKKIGKRILLIWSTK